ncbi:hypothetical protein [Achromobacter phage tuull]|nr:hypothetical protein [Achromobacter phage tuull]
MSPAHPPDAGGSRAPIPPWYSTNLIPSSMRTALTRLMSSW